MHALVIGGTRNLGPPLVAGLLEDGYEVAVLNRGQTPAELPAAVERLVADRGDAAAMRAALGGREFDLVVDTTLYLGRDAGPVVELLAGRAGHYVFISTGQVYLVRIGPQRPFRESDYDGPVMAEPPQSAQVDHPNWVYGAEKRAAEDALMRGWRERQFPVTVLRLPMVNSERDHYNRIYGYLLRLRDGGPILAPAGPDLPLRHVYGGDVIRAIRRVAGDARTHGQAYNIGQDESVELEDFLHLLAEMAGARLRLVRAPREKLDELGLLPSCSPFSDAWMSSLDNARSKAELGIAYTPVVVYLKKLVEHYAAQPSRAVEQYARRETELQVARELKAT